MRSIHLTIMIFFQALLASFILYSNLASASPVNQVKPQQRSLKDPVQPQNIEVKSELKYKTVPVPVASEQKPQIERDAVHHHQPYPKQHHSVPESNVGRSAAPVVPVVAPVPVQPVQAPVITHFEGPAPSVESPQNAKSALVRSEAPVLQVAEVKRPVQPIAESPRSAVVIEKVAEVPRAQPAFLPPAPAEPTKVIEAPKMEKVAHVEMKAKSVDPVVKSLPEQPATAPLVSKPIEEVRRMSEAPAAVPEVPKKVVEPSVVAPSHAAPARVPEPEVVSQVVFSKHQSPFVPPAVRIADPSVVSVEAERNSAPASSVISKHTAPSQPSSVANRPVVKGGLGPLHMLATTLCNYQPEKMVADETLNQLYCQRATLRRSLFDFMSLKFTNLEKLSSSLNQGLEVVPPKSLDRIKTGNSFAPSHGWPVVGKCTAHDLKLMAEAAWCECEDTACAGKVQQAASTVPQVSSEELDKQVPKINSNRHRADGARYLEQPMVAAEQSAVISKILRVADIKDAPVVESSIASLNLTQQQLASIQAQATGDVSRECKHNALRLTRGLFKHLAEDQSKVSDTWPKLYSQLYEDDCARRRVIDIVSALSGFRSESTSIRRDNVEFAFAMDDLRAKVLETDINTPLTFDRQFIEIEQFLQQSVKLMLANIDPGRAKLTSARYRSLMPGPLSADDQCVELHQRLMANNYPTDCNPNQFGQLPDVLRMTANSLALWSVEKELAKYSSRAQEYPSIMPASQPKSNVNECIANLVSS